MLLEVGQSANHTTILQEFRREFRLDQHSPRLWVSCTDNGHLYIGQKGFGGGILFRIYNPETLLDFSINPSNQTHFTPHGVHNSRHAGPLTRDYSIRNQYGVYSLLVDQYNRQGLLAQPIHPRLGNDFTYDHLLCAVHSLLVQTSLRIKACTNTRSLEVSI